MSDERAPVWRFGYGDGGVAGRGAGISTCSGVWVDDSFGRGAGVRGELTSCRGMDGCFGRVRGGSGR